MSKNPIVNILCNDLIRLLELFLIKSACTVLFGWLGEMDGETTEEDWRIHTNHSRLDGKVGSPSFKKVFKDSSDSIHH